jgi:hypothetical protein
VCQIGGTGMIQACASDFQTRWHLKVLTMPAGFFDYIVLALRDCTPALWRGIALPVYHAARRPARRRLSHIGTQRPFPYRAKAFCAPGYRGKWVR